MNYSNFLSEASKVLRTSSVEMERIILTAPYRYKHYTIPKRDGRPRDIHHPSPALKEVQRWITNCLLRSLPVHECVYSYRHGRNIGMHAAQHSRSNFITRFDFCDFFPSITGAVIRSLLVDAKSKGLLDLDGKVIDAIVRLVCRFDKHSNGLVLSIGAPSSPHLSNALLYDFDVELAQIVGRMNGIYTRYADDIYVSSGSRELIEKLDGAFVTIAGRKLPYLKINNKKTQHLSRKRRMSVTGINITPQRQLSVGRDLKRSIKTQIFLASRGELRIEEVSKLIGMLAHVSSVEPEFMRCLVKKFGTANIQRVLDWPLSDIVTLDRPIGGGRGEEES